MITVNKILDKKGSAVWSVRPDATVLEAIKMMDDKNIGALAVMSGQDIVGIFSERDYTRRVYALGRDPRDIQVREVMTKDVLYAKPSQLCEEVLYVMSKHDIRHMPVIEDSREVLGMVSIGDMAKEIIELQKLQIVNLEHYVNWSERY